MTDQNINPNDNYPEENHQGDFGEIGAFQDSEGTIKPVNSNEDIGITPEDVAQPPTNADDDQNQIDAPSHVQHSLYQKGLR